MRTASTVSDLVSQPYKLRLLSVISKTEKIDKGCLRMWFRLDLCQEDEPAFLLDSRLRAFRQWLKMESRNWSRVSHRLIDLFRSNYLLRLDPSNATRRQASIGGSKLLETFDKLGIR